MRRGNPHPTGGGKVFDKNSVESIARECGLTARYQSLEDGWSWYVTTAKGLPCFQGSAGDAALWMQGYRRAIEEERKRWEEKIDRVMQAIPVVETTVDGGYVWSVCSECGANVRVDEDGCCTSCGCAALCYGKRGTTQT